MGISGVGPRWAPNVDRDVPGGFRGKAGEAITQDKVVYESGTVGGYKQFKLADATAAGEHSSALYVMYGSVANGGLMQAHPTATIKNVNTAGSAVGNSVYLGTNGSWSLTVPASSKVIRRIGTVLVVNATTGVIELTPNMWENIPTIVNEPTVARTIYFNAAHNAEVTWTADRDLIVLDAHAIKTAATGAGTSRRNLTEGANLITQINLASVAEDVVVRATTADITHATVAAGEVIKWTPVGGSSNAAIGVVTFVYTAP
jgi:hypothetical protein